MRIPDVIRYKNPYPTNLVNKGKSLVYYTLDKRAVFCYHYATNKWSIGSINVEREYIKTLKNLISKCNHDFHITGKSVIGIDGFTRGNMCHVLFDHFEREFQASQENIDYENFLLCDTSWDWAKESFEKVAKTPHKISYLLPNTLYLIDNLIVYSQKLLPRHPANDADKNYLTYLRGRFHEFACKLIAAKSSNVGSDGIDTQPTTDQKIFISRRSISRMARNQEEVESLFSHYGFKILHFEDLSFEDQVLTAFNAKYLAGFHGAGLTNLIACQHSATIFEIFTSKGTMAYKLVAEALGNHYTAYNEMTSEDPLNIDCTKLNQMLKDLLHS